MAGLGHCQWTADKWPSSTSQGSQRHAQVADVADAIRTVLVDPLRRHAIGVVGLRVPQPGIEPDRRSERWRRVHVGEQAPGFVQMPAHDAGCSANAAGQVVLRLKTAWRYGTTHIVMSPLEFM